MAKGKMKSFKFDIGNSNEGSLGMVIRVWARRKKEAVQKANRFLGQTDQI